MEKFTLGRKKIGDHFYNFGGTVATHRKATEEAKKLTSEGKVVKLRDQKVNKKVTWIIYWRRDKRRKSHPKKNGNWKETFRIASKKQKSLEEQYRKLN